MSGAQGNDGDPKEDRFIPNMSVGEMVDFGHRRERRQLVVASSIVTAAVLVTVLTIVACVYFVFQAKWLYDAVVRTTDERTVLYKTELLDRDRIIAELRGEVARLSPDSPLLGRVLATGPNDLEVRDCQIAQRGTLLVDFELLTGCASAASISPDGTKFAIVTPERAAFILDDGGAILATAELESEPLKLGWNGENLLLVTANGEQSLSPLGQPDPINRANFRVDVQFAGAIVRGDMVTFSEQLVRQGWNVPGSKKGGERTEAAFGYNEVRYGSDEDLPAAEALASEASQASIAIGLQPLSVQKVAAIGAGALEIWVSLK